MRMLDVWLDNPTIGGSGRRRVLELERGGKLTTLFYPPCLARVKVANSEVDHQGREVGWSPGEIRAIIKRAVDRAERGTTLYDEEKMALTVMPFRYPKKVVKALLKELKRLPKYVLVETANRVRT